MAKKNIRLENSDTSINSPAPERRRTVRATTRKQAIGLDLPTPEATVKHTGSPAVVRDTAAEMHTGGEGNGTPSPTFEQISEAAYLRYLERGGQHGYDYEDWIIAERSLRSRS
jgi:hypothetical protein